MLLGAATAVTGPTGGQFNACGWRMGCCVGLLLGVLLGWLLGLLPGQSLGAVVGLSLGKVTGLSVGALLGLSEGRKMGALLGLSEEDGVCCWMFGRNFVIQQFSGNGSVVEVGCAAPQQLPVIRHCVTHLWEAKNKSFLKVNHTMSDDWQLLRSGEPNFNNIPRTKPAQKFEVTVLHTRARHSIVEPLHRSFLDFSTPESMLFRVDSCLHIRPWIQSNGFDVGIRQALRFDHPSEFFHQFIILISKRQNVLLVIL